MSEDLFETTDPRKCIVKLTRRRYEGHILSGHPEITEVEWIRRTVEAPHFIAQDSNSDLVEIYHRRYLYPPNPKLWIRVVVKQGNILTAHLASNLKESEKVIWFPKSS